MRPSKISDEKVFQGLSDVFRRKGYDGASYSDLMKATGLVKASLYHRFPGGKARGTILLQMNQLAGKKAGCLGPRSIY